MPGKALGTSASNIYPTKTRSTALDMRSNRQAAALEVVSFSFLNRYLCVELLHLPCFEQISSIAKEFNYALNQREDTK